MLKKSAAKKFKSIIYPVAFILIVILSALYKYVFKGSGDITLQGFKSGKTASVTETTAPDDLYQETGIFAVCVSIRAMLIASVNKAKTINHLSKGIMKNETDFIRRIQCPKTLWRDAVRFLSENKIGCERVVI